MKDQTVHLLLAFLAGMIAYKMLFARTEGWDAWDLAGVPGQVARAQANEAERLANRAFYPKECARGQIKC